MCTYENWPKATKCAMCGSTPNNSQRSQPCDIFPAPPDVDIKQEERYRSTSTLKGKFNMLYGVQERYTCEKIKTSSF